MTISPFALLMIRTALQPTYGKLYKVFNVKWVFLSAVTIFESISLLEYSNF